MNDYVNLVFLSTFHSQSILTPSNTFYQKLGQECVAAGCGVDLFLFPNAYIDLATIGEVCKLTGGQVGLVLLLSDVILLH